jgi:hypothetical protein
LRAVVGSPSIWLAGVSCLIGRTVSKGGRDLPSPPVLCSVGALVKYCILYLLVSWLRLWLPSDRSIDRFFRCNGDHTSDKRGCCGVGVAVMEVTNDRCLGRCCGRVRLSVSDGVHPVES